MFLRKLILTALIISIMSGAAFAALYSDLQLGTRASALGGAFVTLARDADAIYWNPAALGLAKKSNAMFMYSDVFNVGIKQSYLAYSQPMSTLGLGASWLCHSSDLEEGFAATQKTNSWVDDMYSIALGSKVKQDLYAGINVKRFKVKTDRSSVSNVGTSGTGFDLGLLLTNLGKSDNSYVSDVSIGFQVRNLATDLSGENVDPSFKLGISSKIYDDLLMAVGLDMDNDNEDQSQKIRVNMGAEYNFNNTLFIRLGLNNGDFTTGFGLLLKEQLSIDYAFEKSLGELNSDNHRFSLSF